MPLCSDPNRTTTFKIADGPDEPEFTTRFLTARQWSQVQSLIDKAIDRENNNSLDDLLAAIDVGVVGWTPLRNPDDQSSLIVYAPGCAGLADALTNGELWGVVYGMLGAVQAVEADRKKSESRQTSEPGTSAATVPADGA